MVRPQNLFARKSKVNLKKMKWAFISWFIFQNLSLFNECVPKGGSCSIQLPGDLIKGETYEARIRVKPMKYNSTWSEWSPPESWVATVGKEKPTPAPPAPNALASGFFFFHYHQVCLTWRKEDLFNLLKSVLLWRLFRTGWIIHYFIWICQRLWLWEHLDFW